MSDFQEFLENSLQQKIKQLIPLTGGASADINRIILANEDELIVRRTLSQEKSVMAIPKILEAKIQKVVKKNGAPVPAIIFEFSEGEEIGEGYVMEAIPGETIPRKILRDKKFASAREKLPFEIGKSLAKIHQTQLDDLKALDQVTFSDSLGKLFQVYLSFNQPQPVFDLAFKWLEAQKLTEYGDVLVHGDFRFGNFIISEENLESFIDSDDEKVLADKLLSISTCSIQKNRINRSIQRDDFRDRHSIDSLPDMLFKAIDECEREKAIQNSKTK